MDEYKLIYTEQSLEISMRVLATHKRPITFSHHNFIFILRIFQKLTLATRIPSGGNFVK